MAKNNSVRWGEEFCLRFGDVTAAERLRQNFQACKVWVISVAENKWHQIDVIYYEYGSLVLTYQSRDKATQVFKLLQNCIYGDKQLYVMLLPNIQVH